MARVEHVLVVDLASVRFNTVPDGSSVSVQLATGETVGIVDVDTHRNRREAAIQAIDAALDRGRVVRHTIAGTKVRARVVFYNPTTAEVAVGALPVTRAYTDRSPLALDVSGQLAELDGDTLRVGSRTLRLREPSEDALRAAWTAHHGQSPR